MKDFLKYVTDNNLVTHIFGFALIVFAAYGYIRSGFHDYLGAGTFLSPGIGLILAAHGWSK